MHRGEPSLFISVDEEASLAELFRFTLVDKFSHRKPKMVEISFSLLPIHLRAKEFLFSLAKIIGAPLRIDEATFDLLRPSEACVCVEVNLEHKLSHMVWIDRGEGRSFWQSVIYENPLPFCAKCQHIGHEILHYRMGIQPETPISHSAPVVTEVPTSRPIATMIPISRPVVDRASKGKGKENEVFTEPPKQWVPVVGS
ncbi:Uncharacterized protein Adt_27255 [Abeliophyllum distichum]|uniref:DUF4283 domain-containing protein n=1 Tax=Abeliophyllum distichum TaxID=126358 RepID=A0ABD1RT93_9LAMI